MNIVELTHHLIADSNFRTQILTDPSAALGAAELDLTCEEIERFSRLPWRELLSRQIWKIGPDTTDWWVSPFTHCAEL